MTDFVAVAKSVVVLGMRGCDERFPIMKVMETWKREMETEDGAGCDRVLTRSVTCLNRGGEARQLRRNQYVTRRQGAKARECYKR
jgi:hypothetical protein